MRASSSVIPIEVVQDERTTAAAVAANEEQVAAVATTTSSRQSSANDHAEEVITLSEQDENGLSPGMNRFSWRPAPSIPSSNSSPDQAQQMAMMPAADSSPASRDEEEVARIVNRYVNKKRMLEFFTLWLNFMQLEMVRESHLRTFNHIVVENVEFLKRRLLRKAMYVWLEAVVTRGDPAADAARPSRRLFWINLRGSISKTKNHFIRQNKGKCDLRDKKCVVK